MPIDITWLREDQGGDPEKWRENERKRFGDPAIVDRVLVLDREWRALTTQIRDEKKEANQLSTEVRRSATPAVHARTREPGATRRATRARRARVGENHPTGRARACAPPARAADPGRVRSPAAWGKRVSWVWMGVSRRVWVWSLTARRSGRRSRPGRT